MYYAAYDVFTIREIVKQLRSNHPPNLTKVIKEKLKYENPPSTKYQLKWVNDMEVLISHKDEDHKEDINNNYEEQAPYCRANDEWADRVNGEEVWECGPPITYTGKPNPYKRNKIVKPYDRTRTRATSRINNRLPRFIPSWGDNERPASAAPTPPPIENKCGRSHGDLQG